MQLTGIGTVTRLNFTLTKRFSGVLKWLKFSVSTTNLGGLFDSRPMRTGKEFLKGLRLAAFVLRYYVIGKSESEWNILGSRSKHSWVSERGTYSQDKTFHRVQKIKSRSNLYISLSVCRIFITKSKVWLWPGEKKPVLHHPIGVGWYISLIDSFAHVSVPPSFVRLFVLFSRVRPFIQLWFCNRMLKAFFLALITGINSRFAVELGLCCCPLRDTCLTSDVEWSTRFSPRLFYDLWVVQLFCLNGPAWTANTLVTFRTAAGLRIILKNPTYNRPRSEGSSLFDDVSIKLS